MADDPAPAPESAGLTRLLFSHPAGDDEPLVHTIDASRTAGEIRAGARAVAARLGELGIGGFAVRDGTPAPRSGTGADDEPTPPAVAVQVPDGPDTVTAMFGVWLAGAVYVPVNPRAPAAERDRIVASTGASVLWTTDGVSRPEVDAATSDRLPPGAAFVTWTSGTTGAPKPVVHTHAGYLELLDRVLGPLGRERRPDRPPSPNLVPVALTLNAGIYNICFGLRAGAALVLLPRFTTTDFATLVARHGIRSTVLAPAAITMLNDDPSVTDLAPLRYVRSITAPLSPLQARRFHDRFGVVVLNGYGQAEIGEVIGWTAADARDHPDKLGAVGRPHPGVEIRVDPESGELLVKPPSRARSDLGGLEGRVTADGFVRTGDLARVDDDGFVWIEGRRGDVINRGGNKVFPDAVEEVLRLHDAVADVAVAGVPDERLGEVPHAFVVLHDDVPPDVSPGELAPDLVAALDALCRDHLVPYKVPVAYHRVDELARNEAGKVLRSRLVAPWSPAAPGPTAS